MTGGGSGIGRLMALKLAKGDIHLKSATFYTKFATKYFFVYFFDGLECLGPSFAYVAHFVFLRDVWILTQRAAVASRRAANLATLLPNNYPSP
jgi:hypothetical protein